MKRVGDNPLVMLSPAGKAVVLSALKVLHKANAASMMHGELHRRCRDVEWWCAQFLRHLGGGPNAMPSSVDAVLSVGITSVTN